MVFNCRLGTKETDKHSSYTKAATSPTSAMRSEPPHHEPAVGMGVIGTMAFALDPGHLERMASVARPNRTPAAVLFADLESSSVLSRTLSTANYFALGRRIVRATDQCVVDAGGLVGRHVGDGIVAFFPSVRFGVGRCHGLHCNSTRRKGSADRRSGAVRTRS